MQNLKQNRIESEAESGHAHAHVLAIPPTGQQMSTQINIAYKHLYTENFIKVF